MIVHIFYAAPSKNRNFFFILLAKLYARRAQNICPWSWAQDRVIRPA